RNVSNYSMEFDEFYSQMDPLLKLLEKVEIPLQGPEGLDPILEEWLRKSFKSGCPQNVVPCAYFNISLKGYTDFIIQRPTTMKALGNFLGEDFTRMIQIALDHIEIK